MSNKILLVYEEYSEMMSAQSLLQKVGFDVLSISTEYTLSENVLSFNPDIVVASGRTGKVTTIGVGRRLREMTRWQGRVILVLPAGYKPNPQDFAKIRADMLLEAPLPALRLMQVIGKMLNIDEAVLQERLSKHGNETAKDPNNLGMVPPNMGDDAVIDGIRVTGGAAEELEKIEVYGKTPELEDLAPMEKPTFSFNISPDPAAEPEKKSDQDLEKLWDELTEGAAEKLAEEEEEEEGEKKKVSFDLSENEISDREIEGLRKNLEDAQATVAERVAKYAKYTAQIDNFDRRQSLNKADTRKAQQDLAKSWNLKEIEALDELRRNFTKALFRKK